MSNKTYCEIVAQRLKGKKVEIYTGDIGIILKQGDGDNNVKSIIRGIVKEAEGDCLIINYTKNYNHVLDGKDEGTPIFINGYSITALTELTGGTSIVEAYHNEHTKVKK